MVVGVKSEQVEMPDPDSEQGELADSAWEAVRQRGDLSDIAGLGIPDQCAAVYRPASPENKGAMLSAVSEQVVERRACALIMRIEEAESAVETTSSRATASEIESRGKMHMARISG